MSALRRDFQLPPSDEEFLDRQGRPWEAVNDGSMWLLIQDWDLPDGYNVPKACLALRIPPAYPVEQIDMAYFLPALQRADGVQINALSSQVILGENWQQWSRHRTATNPWRPGTDDIASHLSLVMDCLHREFLKE